MPLASAAGNAFVDFNDNGGQDIGEAAIPNVQVYVDLNENGIHDALPLNTIEPDDYAAGQVLDTAHPDVTLTAVVNGNVTFSVTAEPFSFGASTGVNTFAVQGVGPAVWGGSAFSLELDFAAPVDTIELDFTGLQSSPVGLLELYDGGGSLLQTVTTSPLPTGQSETLTANIAGIERAVAKTVSNASSVLVALDHLEFGNTTFEPIDMTDATGDYAFPSLAAGDYVIRSIIPNGFRQTTPAINQRLFRTDLHQTPRIVEFDLHDGSEINAFPFPSTPSFQNGLAFDGSVLYFIADAATNDTLFELDPDTGAVLDSMVLPAGGYNGLAALDGLVYVMDNVLDDVLIIDPATNSIQGQLDINGTNPGVFPLDGLGELPGTSELVVLEPARAIIVDSSTGVMNTFFALNGNGPRGITTVGNEIYIGYPQGDVEVYDRNGNLLRVVYVNYNVFALGGFESSDGAHHITLGANQSLTGLDFGYKALNDPPNADAGGPYSVIAGNTVTLHALGSSDPNQDGLTYDWDLDGDGVFGETGVAAARGDETGWRPEFSAVGLSGPSTFSVQLRATDPGGLFDVDSEPINILANTAPTAVAGGPYTVDEEGSVYLIAGGSFDPDQTQSSLVLEWDLDGDGVFGESGTAAAQGNETGIFPQFSAVGIDGPGTRSVSLRVTDNNGLTDQQTAQINIVNVSPELVNPNSVHLLGGVIDQFDTNNLELTTPSIGLQKFLINNNRTQREYDIMPFNDYFIETFDNLPANITRAWLRIEMRPEALLATNDTFNLGIWNDGTGVADVHWRARIGSGGSPAVPNLLPGPWGAFHFPGTTELMLDLDDLPADGTLTSLLATMNAYGRLDLFIQDDTNVDYVELWIETPGNPLDLTPVIDEGDSVTLSGTITEPSPIDTFTLDIDWGNTGSPLNQQTVSLGATPINSGGIVWNPTTGDFAIDHQYVDDNPSVTAQDVYQVNVLLSDDDGGQAPASASTVVRNVDPAIISLASSATLQNKGTPGTRVSVNGAFTDAALGVASETFTAVVDWGDQTTSIATISGGTFTANHAYSTGGIFPISVMLADDDGGLALDDTLAFVTGAGVVNNILYVVGTAGSDHVNVIEQGNGTTMVQASFLSGPPVMIPTLSFSKTIAYLCDGHDSMSVASSLPAIIHAGDGNDRIRVGQGPSVILGEGGNDLVLGGTNRDILIGGTGSDRLIGGGNDDLLIGGSTTDDNNDNALMTLLDDWTMPTSYQSRVAMLAGLITVIDDLQRDRLTGNADLDLFYQGVGDSLLDVQKLQEIVL